jgi:hypothetical protein
MKDNIINYSNLEPKFQAALVADLGKSLKIKSKKTTKLVELFDMGNPEIIIDYENATMQISPAGVKVMKVLIKEYL